MLTDGTEYRTLYVTPAYPTNYHKFERPLAWSPDGKNIAFMTFQWERDPRYPDPTKEQGKYQGETNIGPVIDSLGSSLLMASVDGSGVRKVAADLPVYAYSVGYTPRRSLSWSPDGTRILFTDAYSTPGSVYTVRLDGSLLRRIAEGLYASWSPDGSKIAVVNPDSDSYLTIVGKDDATREIVATASLDGGPEKAR